MPSPTGAFSLSAMLQNRGIDLGALGAAYLVMLSTLLLTAPAFAAARHYIVISPNRWTRDFGVYASLVLGALLIAIVLENESLPLGSATLHYVAVPQLLLLLAVHLSIWYRQEPWLVALGASATAATVVVGAAIGVTTDLFRPAYWVTLLLLTVLMVFVWRKAVSTKQAFMTGHSSDFGSKESLDALTTEQQPWLGLVPWATLIAASVSLAVGNALLRGKGLGEIAAVEVAAESFLLLVVTALVCTVPTVSYWVAHRAWMPELTRFVWLAWILVGFAFTYSSYLNVLARG